MNTILSVFSDVMLWLSIPLFAVLSYWEEKLALSGSDRALIQFFMIAGIFVWITLWYSVGENERLTHRRVEKPKIALYTQEPVENDPPCFHSRDEELPIPFPVKKPEELEMIERNTYVSHH